MTLVCARFCVFSQLILFSTSLAPVFEFSSTPPHPGVKAASVLAKSIEESPSSADTKSAQADVESIESLESLTTHKGYLLVCGAGKFVLALSNVPLDEKEVEQVLVVIKNGGLSKDAENLSVDVLMLAMHIVNRAFLS